MIAKFFDFGDQKLDLWNDIRWNAVGSMLNFAAFAVSGTPKETSYSAMGTHIVTPESEISSHYFLVLPAISRWKMLQRTN